MICLNCKKQIPDDSDRCPHCGVEVFHKNQLAREIGFRRYQRWIFYGLFTLAFIGMVGIVVKVYNLNTKLLLEISNVQGSVSQKDAELVKAKNDLADLLKTKADLEAQNKKVSNDLKEQITAAEDAVAEKIALQSRVDQTSVKLSGLGATLQNIAKVASAITQADLNRIPFADVAYAGADSDNDGLADELEAALGTNASSTDSDGDTYADLTELIGGFDPAVAGGKFAIDKAFAAVQKGRIFKQDGGYLWYVGADAKRYFLGKAE
jgi:hypothetical protein